MGILKLKGGDKLTLKNLEGLKVYMASRNMSNKDLAERIGVSQTYISRIVNGHKIPSLKMAYRISVELDCTIDDLISPRI